MIEEAADNKGADTGAMGFGDELGEVDGGGVEAANLCFLRLFLNSDMMEDVTEPPGDSDMANQLALESGPSSCSQTEQIWVPKIW